jgi:hypothetical protein
MREKYKALIFNCLYDLPERRMLRRLEPILLNRSQNSLKVKEYSLKERLRKTNAAEPSFRYLGREDARPDADFVLR